MAADHIATFFFFFVAVAAGSLQAFKPQKLGRVRLRFCPTLSWAIKSNDSHLKQ